MLRDTKAAAVVRQVGRWKRRRGGEEGGGPYVQPR